MDSVDSSNLPISNPGRYNIDELLRSYNIRLGFDEKMFVDHLCTNRQVFFDWRNHAFWVADRPCTVDRASKKIFIDGVDISEDEDGSHWTRMDPSRFHEIAASCFSGEYGTTNDDIVAIMELSGITVELFNGPDAPERFMEELRERIHQVTSKK